MSDTDSLTDAPSVGGPGSHGLPDLLGRLGSLDLASALLRLTRMLNHLHAGVAKRHCLTPVQSRLLCTLLPGPIGMAALAEILGIERAALTGLVDRAERGGLVVRRTVPNDRRATHVALTDAGRDAAEAFRGDFHEAVESLLESMEPSHRALFREGVITLIETGERLARS